MGREVKRVALDFEWPKNKVWEGFIMPAEIAGHPCTDPNCDNGSTVAFGWVERIAHLLLMLDDDLDSQERGRGLHPWLLEVPLNSGRRPGPEIREFGTGLAGRPGGFFGGHDAIDRWSATRKIVKAAGLPKSWGLCPSCKGSAWAYDSKEQKKAAKAWEPTEPPAGEGWQLWETVSEGSPVSPVFPTAEALAEWINPAEPEKSLAWITSGGWAPSMIAAGGVIVTSSELAEGQTV